MESAQDTFHKREGLGGRWEKDEHQDQPQQPDPHLSPNKMQPQNLIFIGGAQPCYKMPAERKLAGELDIHRNTVIKAYGELVDEGYLIVSSKRPKGYFVKEIADDGVHSSAFSRWRK